MTPAPQPPPASELPSQPRFRELSRTFWRGINTTHGLGPAIENVLNEYNAHLGTRRASVWLHDRRPRELWVVASSDPGYHATPRVAITDPDVPAARGLRLERAQILDDGAETVIISPLRGWRRALGTLVIEGPPADLDDQQRLDLADELGRQLSAGIENVQLLEDMLRQRRLLEDTFNSLLDPVVVADRNMRIVQMNDAFAMRLGKPRAELLDRSLADLVGSDLAEWAATKPDEPENGGERSRTVEHAELGGIFSVTPMPLINEDGEQVGTVIVLRDITQQTRLEAEKEALRAQLAQSEKLASLGQFVAGIAHEINNPLQGVLGHLELIIGSPEAAGSPDLTRALRKDLRLVYREADRAAKIVRNLLTFTGSQRKTRRRVLIDRVLTRVLAGRQAAFSRAGIEVIRHQGDDLPPMLGDPLLLQQALINVIINAEHAIIETGKPGSITITTARTPRGVSARIRDTGPGIPPDVLPRIFDPFFTTKDVGQGTGLGLAITYGIIQEHGGTISASNDPAGGAVFTVELPADRTDKGSKG